MLSKHDTGWVQFFLVWDDGVHSEWTAGMGLESHGSWLWLAVDGVACFMLNSRVVYPFFKLISLIDGSQMFHVVCALPCCSVPR